MLAVNIKILKIGLAGNHFNRITHAWYDTRQACEYTFSIILFLEITAGSLLSVAENEGLFTRL